MSKPNTSFILLAASMALSLLPLPASATAQSLAWKRDAGTVGLLCNGQVVWQFNFGTNATKPFFHPVALPNGPVLTWNQPADHPWHHGLWFSWKFINGVNYWEEDPKTGLADGQTAWREPRIETRPDFSARIQMDLDYHPATNEQVVLTEHRVIEISPPDAEGAYHQDWMMTFVAGREEVRLERTPLPGEPGGQSWGGYAGLSVRLAPGITEPQALTSREPVQFLGGNYRSNAAAMDYTGSFAGREAGVAILDCASNLNSPSPWYAISGNPMHYFSPAVLCYQPHTLKAGQQLSLRYRVIVHSGRWTAEQLRQATEWDCASAGANAAAYLQAYQGKPFQDTRHPGLPQIIPGRVQCAAYDLGGEGIAYHDADAANHGSGELNPANGTYLNEFRMNEGVDISYTKFHDQIDNNPYNLVQPPEGQLYVGWTKPGEWFNLTVAVQQAAIYTMDLLYTSNKGGTISLDRNGECLVPSMNIVSTRNEREPIAWRQWHHWNILTNLAEVKLPKGVCVLTLHVRTEGDMNLAYLDFIPRNLETGQSKIPQP